MTAVLSPHPAATRHHFRAQVCRLVDRLIAVLDDIDGDPDIEDQGDDEPSLAHPETAPRESQSAVAAWLPIGGVQLTDLEDECEGEGSQCDDEGHDSDQEPDPSDVGIGETGEGPQ